MILVQNQAPILAHMTIYKNLHSQAIRCSQASAAPARKPASAEPSGSVLGRNTAGSGAMDGGDGSTNRGDFTMILAIMERRLRLSFRAKTAVPVAKLK